MGSPVTLSGFNNIDFKAIVDIIIRSERQPIDQLAAQQVAQQSRLTAYGSLSSSLLTLKSSLDALNDATAYGNLQASSSDTTVLTVSATSLASKGSFTLNVTSLARPQVTSSTAGQFSDINATIINGGSLSITQNGSTTNVDLTGVTTLAQLRDAINNQQSGVKASIINDGSTGSPAKPFRLVLTSAAAGTTNSFSVNDQTTFNVGTPGTVLNLSTDGSSGVAQDTVFTYNGISIHSTSTTVTDSIPGLNLTLLKTGTATVTVTDDNFGLKTKIKAFVDAFNSFDDFYKNQNNHSTNTNSQGPLANDPLLRSLNRQIRTNFIDSLPNSGSIQNLASFGVRLNTSGKLEIDNAALDAALTNSGNDVKTFLFGTSGFAATVSNLIDGYTSSTGSIGAVKTRLQQTIDVYSVNIQKLEVQLSFRRDALTREFTAADQAISQLNSQVNALAGLNAQFRLF